MALFNSSLPPDSEAVKNGANRIRSLTGLLDLVLGIIFNDTAVDGTDSDANFKLAVIPGSALKDHSVTTQQLDQSTVITLLQVPTGVVLPYSAGLGGAPTNWLFCDGAQYSRSLISGGTVDTYKNLWNLIGTTYGAGDGHSTFNVPDLRGRAPFGMDNMGTGQGSASRITGSLPNGSGPTPSDSIGGTGGEQNHQLIASETPSHTHFIANTDVITTPGALGAAQQLAQVVQQSGGDNPSYHLTGSATAATIGKTSSVGGDGSHNTIPPAIFFTYIIRI